MNSEEPEEPQGLQMWLVNRFNAVWLMPEWWQYVFDDSRADKEYGPCPVYYHELPRFIPERLAERFNFEYANPIRKLINFISRCACRARQHPAGVYFYNPSGWEPDMHCKGCGQDLG